MIKVLINGSHIYDLEFKRRKYKTIHKRKPTVQQLLKHVDLAWRSHCDPSAELSLADVAKGYEAAKGGKPLYETTALIFIAEPKQGEPPVATGTSKQHEKDDNRRVVGRGIALKNLLHAERDGKAVFTKIEQDAIREAYNNRAKQSHKPLPPAGSAGGPPTALVRKMPATVVKFEQPKPGLHLRVA